MEDQKSLADLTLDRERLNEGVTEDCVPTHECEGVLSESWCQECWKRRTGAMTEDRVPTTDACPDCGGVDHHLKGCPNPVPRFNTVRFTPPAQPAPPLDGEALYRVWWQASWDATDNPPQWEQLSKDKRAVWAETARTQPAPPLDVERLRRALERTSGFGRDIDYATRLAAEYERLAPR